MKRFIAICLLVITALTSCAASATLVPVYEYNGYTYSDMNALQTRMEEQLVLMDAAHNMAESARTLGYAEDHAVIILAQDEWWEAYHWWETYQAIYNDLSSQWAVKESEYPAAAYIWSYFKSLGYSDYVCAGIMGNLMAEAGGQTLAIQYDAMSPGYYGMCQWSKAYTEVWYASLEEQCVFLQQTIQYELDTYGYAYKRGFNYEKFLQLTDCEQVALAFAKCYERCHKASYTTRQRNSIIAYNYFVS